MDASTGLACWGGLSDLSDLGNTPTDPNGYLLVSAGYLHNCALDSFGNITCWGLEGSYVEAEGYNGTNYTSYYTGAILEAPSGNGYTSVSAGMHHSCAIDAAGSIECWGNDDYGQISARPTGNGFTSVSAGGYHNCALDVSGSIHCWGQDSQGQVSDVPGGSGHLSVSAGYRSTCSLDALGDIECWGHDIEGSVNDSPTGAGYTQVSAGYVHNCALDLTGAVSCWGDDYYGGVSLAPTGSGYSSLSANCIVETVDGVGKIQCWSGMVCAEPKITGVGACIRLDGW
jgi:alpha-tubulin suppressor-like RCC1 family protein